MEQIIMKRKDRKKLIMIMEKKYDMLWDMKNDNEHERDRIAGGLAILEAIYGEYHGK